MQAYSDMAPFYDSLTGDVDYDSFAGYYKKVFAKYGDDIKTVLDLACGTGTLTLLMASEGYEMIGVDASADMLAEANMKASELELPIKPLFIEQTMQELDLYGTVDAAYCSLDGINYVPHEDLDTVFGRLKYFVRPGGLFIFDVNSTKKLLSLDGEMFIDENDDVYCVWRCEYDPEDRSVFYGIDIFSRQEDLWERDFEEHTEFVHETQELKSALINNGFTVLDVFGELNFEEPVEDEQRLFFICRRN